MTSSKGPDIPLPPPDAEPPAVAEAAGLRYVCGDEPGFRRVRHGAGFRYVDAEGRPVRDRLTLARIRALVIPPAWTDVWICAFEDGHLQATGRDARGRKQYRYHERWSEVRTRTNFHRMIRFGEVLPGIRARVERDLARRGLSRERVLAAVVRLIDRTLIRVGNDEYARANESFGLTTLLDEHVEVTGTRIHLHFRGKRGKEHDVELRSRRLSRVIRACLEIPGQELFRYRQGEGHHAVDSGDVNAYLREAAGEAVTAKDFRTWGGTVIAARVLIELGPGETQTQRKKNVVVAIDRTSALLHNTRAVCRRHYVHPEVVEAYLAGTLLEQLEAARAGLDDAAAGAEGLEPDELAVLAFLRARPAAPEPEPPPRRPARQRRRRLKRVASGRAGRPRLRS